MPDPLLFATVSVVLLWLACELLVLSGTGRIIAERDHRSAGSSADSGEAIQRAWELLEGLLNPWQKLEAKTGRITEVGKYGKYSIPLRSDGFKLVHFTPNESLSVVLPYVACLAGGLQADCFYRLCLRETAGQAPWHDAVATFLLHIRAGKEVQLLTRANFIEHTV